MTPAACCLCGQIRGSGELNLLKPLLATPWSQRPILRENRGAAVMPSVGALVPGHVLVCPKTHVRSLATAPSWCVDELDALVEQTIRVVAQQTGDPIHAFEHGSARFGSRIACSVEHAHLHVVPARVSVSDRLHELAEWRPIDCSHDSLVRAVGAREYLLYRDPAGARLVSIAPAEGFPSQLMRRVFADALGISRWNWREDPARDSVRSTVDIFLRPPTLIAHG